MATCRHAYCVKSCVCLSLLQDQASKEFNRSFALIFKGAQHLQLTPTDFNNGRIRLLK